MSKNTTVWTTPDDITARVRRRWSSGELLSAYARGEPLEPITVALRGPAAGAIAADLERVRAWVVALERGARRRGQPTYRLERRQVGGRVLGTNELPVRAWVESYGAAWRLLDVETEVERFSEALELTSTREPRLVAWVADHPLRVVALIQAWERLLAAVTWLHANRGRGRYLRQIDVAGVDTKFVEQHSGVLADLLSALHAVDPRSAGDSSAPRRDLARHFGFTTRPAQVRVRIADGAFAGRVLGGLSEATVRLEELARLRPAVRRVFVLENEITYLALPVPANSLVLFGAGYTVSTAGSLPWLSDVEVWYWGDLDTHGFAILNRLRHTCRDVRSLLMDRTTLLQHRAQWGVEPTPTRAHLDRLTPAEHDLYQDLVEDTLGPSVRLEQERVSWPGVEAAISRLE